ncbi:MAG: hypothetical protein ACTSPY_02495 [Candidatus Helarchaeota archaeon]
MTANIHDERGNLAQNINNQGISNLRSIAKQFFLIFKNFNYKNNRNMSNISAPYFFFHKTIEKTNYVIIDIILVRLIKESTQITIEVKEKLYSKTKELQNLILNSGLKINPNSKNTVLSFFKIMDYFSIDQKITYYKSDSGEDKQQIYRILPIILHTEHQNKIKWNSQLDLSLMIIGINILEDVLRDRFDDLIRQENIIKDKNIYERLLNINYLLEYSWVPYLITSLLITTTDYFFSFPDIITNMFSVPGFIIAFLIIYGSCASTRILMSSYLKKELKNEMSTPIHQDIDLSEIIIEQTPRLDFEFPIPNSNQQAVYKNRMVIEKPEISEMNHFKIKLINNYDKFIKSVKDNDLINIQLLLPRLLNDAISYEYDKICKIKEKNILKKYLYLYNHQNYREMVIPNIFDEIYKIINSSSFSLPLFKRMEPTILKILNSLGVVKRDVIIKSDHRKNDSRSILNLENNIIQTSNTINLDRKVYFNKTELCINSITTYNSTTILDFILSALIERTFGTNAVNNLSFYRTQIRREITTLDIITRIKLIYLTKVKDYLNDWKELLKAVIEGNDNIDTKNQLKLFWIYLKQNIWKISIENIQTPVNIDNSNRRLDITNNIPIDPQKNEIEIEVENEIETIEINNESIQMENSEENFIEINTDINIDIQTEIEKASEKWNRVLQINPNTNFKEYIINGYEAIQGLIKVIAAKNNFNLDPITNIERLYKELENKGYYLDHLENFKRLNFIYSKIINGEGNVGTVGMNSIIENLINFYDILTQQLKGPLNYSPKLNRHDNTLQSITTVENTTPEELINEIQCINEINEIQRLNDIQHTSQDSDNNIENNIVSKNITQKEKKDDHIIKDNSGILLAYFDQDIGYIDKYFIDTNKKFDSGLVKKLANIGLRLNDETMFYFKIKEYIGSLYAKRFTVKNYNIRGDTDIYALIIFTDNENIKITEEILDSAIEKIKQNINDNEIIHNIFNSLFIDNLDISNLSNENNEIPLPKDIPSTTVDDFFSGGIPFHVKGLSTQEFQQLLADMPFLSVYYINLRIFGYREYFKQYIEACDYFGIQPYYYDVGNYPNTIINNAYPPCIVISLNKQISILDLSDTPSEKIDEFRRILDSVEKERSDNSSLYELVNQVNSINKNKNTQFKKEINLDIDKIRTEIEKTVSLSDEDLIYKFTNLKNTLHKYNPNDVSIHQLNKYLIFIAKDFDNINIKRNYLITKNIADLIGCELLFLYALEYFNISPKLPEVIPPAIYFCVKTDYLHKIPIEINNNYEYIDTILKMFEAYQKGNFNNYITNNQMETEQIEIPEIKIQNNQSNKNTNEQHKPSQAKLYGQLRQVGKFEVLPRFLKKYQGNKILVILCQDEIFEPIRSILKSYVEKIPILNIISKAPRNEIMYGQICNNLNENDDPNLDNIFEKGVIKIPYNQDNYENNLSKIIERINP